MIRHPDLLLLYTLNAPANPILYSAVCGREYQAGIGTVEGEFIKVELNGATPMEWQLEYDSDQLSRLGKSHCRRVQRAINRHYEKKFWESVLL